MIHISLDLLCFFPSGVIHYINELVMEIKCSPYIYYVLLFVFWIILLRKKDPRTQFFQPNHNKIQSWTQHADTHNAYHLFCSSHRHLLQWIIIIPIIRKSITDRVCTNKINVWFIPYFRLLVFGILVTLVAGYSFQIFSVLPCKM